MNKSSVNWRGNFCAVVTPFSQEGAFSEDLFTRNLELLLKEGIDGFVIAGHTGESWALSPDERFKAFELAVDIAAGKVPVIGNVSAIRTGEAIGLALAAQERGLDGILLTAPAYAMVNARETLEHLRAVSDACQLPMMIYNIPRRTGCDLTPELIRAAADIEHVVALKQSSPSFDEIARVIDLCGDRIHVFAGNSAERGMPAVTLGVSGFVSSVETQALGAEAISLWDLSVAGKFSEARAVQQRCSEVKRFLGKFGTEPAALKVAMNHAGRPGGQPRLPILPLTEDETGKVLAFMDQLFPVAV